MQLKVRLSAMALLVAGATAAHGAEYSGPGGPITDGTTANGTNPSSTLYPITVSGDGGTVVSVNSVTLTNATHTWVGDLEMILRGPNGVAEAILLQAPDNEATNLGGTYTFVVDPSVPTLPQEALNWTGTEAVPSGTYAISGYTDANTPGPRTTFAPLVGQSVDGVWNLIIRDYYSNDTGSLGSWTLNVTSSIPEPASASVAVLAAAGLLARRRRPTRA